MNRLVAYCVFFCCFHAGFGQDAASNSGGWVVIPVQEYGALRGRAFPAAPGEPERRHEAALTKIEYDLKASGAVASGLANLTVDVLQDGWVRIPLPAGLLVREARVDGNRVSLVRDPANGGQLAAVLSRKGRFLLTLALSFSLTGAPGQEQLALPTASAAVTRATVSQTASLDSEVRVTGGFITEKSDARWVAYARGDEPLVFSWRRRIVDQQKRVELPLRMRGALTQLFGLGEDSTSLNAEVEIEVMQGTARRIRIAVPDSVTINQVPGASVADWDVKGGELIVTFLEPVEGSAKFAIHGETRLGREGAISLPLLRLLETERESGGVAAEVLGAGEVKDSTALGLERVDAAELGPMVAARQSPSLAAFRLRAVKEGENRSLKMQVARYTQQAVLTANVEEARYRALLSSDGKTLVQARYAVRNNQRTFLRVTLPESAVVWSSSVAGHPVRPGKWPGGSLLLPLEKSRAGEDAPVFLIEILYLLRGGAAWTGAKGRAVLVLPAVDLPISRTGLILYYPPLFRVTPETGAFRQQPYEKPSAGLWTAAGGPVGPGSSPASSNSPIRTLVDAYRAKDARRTAASTLPAHLAFPAFGPSLYLVSELSDEGKGQTIELSFQTEKKQKDKRGGGK